MTRKYVLKRTFVFRKVRQFFEGTEVFREENELDRFYIIDSCNLKIIVPNELVRES